MPTDRLPTQQESATRAARDGTMRKKQALVAVLVVGLGIALLTQPENEDAMVPQVVEASLTSMPAAVTRPATVDPADVATPATTAAESAIDLTQIRELSRIDRSTLLETELLAPEPPALRRPRVNQVPEVQAVYGTSRGRAAIVGDAIVRDGAPLPGGAVVLGVTDEGIRVSQD